MIVPQAGLIGCDLVVGDVYEGGPTLAEEPLSRLLNVGNMGGIRMKSNSIGLPAYFALYSTGREPEWPDRIDSSTGCVEYHGDNRTPGVSPFSSSGNRALSSASEHDLTTAEGRGAVPVMLLFTHADGYAPRSVRFEGLAVPSPPTDGRSWQNLVSGNALRGSYQNLLLRLILLAVPRIEHRWLLELRRVKGMGTHAPHWYRYWVEAGIQVPLVKLHPVCSRQT